MAKFLRIRLVAVQSVVARADPKAAAPVDIKAVDAVIAQGFRISRVVAEVGRHGALAIHAV
jgi:hypothetical protein